MGSFLPNGIHLHVMTYGPNESSAFDAADSGGARQMCAPIRQA